MNVGIFVFQINTSVDSAVLAKHAEDLGFESYWVPEHAILPVHTTSRFPGSPDGAVPDAYGRIVDPFIALARASAVTQTIKLGTGICLVPEHNPLHLAKVISSLDQASGGRFLFGIGAGWHKEESEMMGGDFAHRWTQTRDAVLAMKALWTQGRSGIPRRLLRFPAGPFGAETGSEHRTRPSSWAARRRTSSSAWSSGATAGCPTARPPTKSGAAATPSTSSPKPPGATPAPCRSWRSDTPVTSRAARPWRN